MHIRLLHQTVEVTDGPAQLLFGVVADRWSYLQIPAVDQQLHPVAPEAVGITRR
jgi:hypothetical protein